VTEFGLACAFVDSARGGRLFDAPEARPALAEAARLGVPVFAHPANPEPPTARPARRLLRLALPVPA
jgi:predicted TIM-barrel fold metal-dependent hydrolase